VSAKSNWVTPQGGGNMVIEVIASTKFLTCYLWLLLGNTRNVYCCKRSMKAHETPFECQNIQMYKFPTWLLF